MSDRSHEGIRKYFEINENENTMYWNLWDAAKAVFRGKFITIKAYIKKDTCNTNNLTSHIKEQQQN